MSFLAIMKLVEPKDVNKYVELDAKWRDLDLLTCLLSILGLILGIIDVRRISFHSFSMNLPMKQKATRKSRLFSRIS